MKVRARISSLLWFAASTAMAGTVEQATILADPQMQMKDGAVHGCGYRLKSVVLGPGIKTTMALDVSFNIYAAGYGLMKGGALQVRADQVDPSKTVVKPIKSFWVKPQGKPAATPMKDKVIAAENKGYLLYGTDVSPVMDLFFALWDKKSVTIGVQVIGEPVERIHTGVVQLSEEDRGQGMQCMTELLEKMEGEDAKPKK